MLLNTIHKLLIYKKVSLSIMLLSFLFSIMSSTMAMELSECDDCVIHILYGDDNHQPEPLENLLHRLENVPSKDLQEYVRLLGYCSQKDDKSHPSEHTKWSQCGKHGLTCRWIPATPKLIGRGGLGSVYKGVLKCKHEEHDDKQVAIKLLARPDTKRERSREVGAMMELSQHPAFPKLYTTGTFGPLEDKQFIVMEFIDGKLLRDLFGNGGGCNGVMEQILKAVSFIWSKGIIHNDLGGRNIMVCSDDNVKIIDFGSSRTFEDGPFSVYCKNVYHDFYTLSRLIKLTVYDQHGKCEPRWKKLHNHLKKWGSQKPHDHPEHLKERSGRQQVMDDMRQHIDDFLANTGVYQPCPIQDHCGIKEDCTDCMIQVIEHKDQNARSTRMFDAMSKYHNTIIWSRRRCLLTAPVHTPSAHHPAFLWLIDELHAAGVEDLLS